MKQIQLYNSLNLSCFLILSLPLLSYTVKDSINRSHEVDCSEVFNLKIQLDGSADEISWTLVNIDRHVNVADGRYFTADDDYELVETAICLESGCYEITIYDEWGDGICIPKGESSIEITSKEGAIILESDGNFGDFITTEFCIDKSGYQNINRT